MRHQTHRHYYLRLWLVLWSVVFCSGYCSAQLRVFYDTDANHLARSICSRGFIVSNAAVHAPDGYYGRFKSISTNLGLDSGVVLSTDSIYGNVGPNNDNGAIQRPTFWPFYSGDLDLDTVDYGRPVISGASFDACVLEFDMIPLGDRIQFSYVYGSEEYPNNCSGYTDNFGFLLSGPKPGGGMYRKFNIGTVPGTPYPVCINSINNGYVPYPNVAGNCYSLSYSQYYVDNGLINTVDVTDSTRIQLNGFTVPLIANAAVIPCATYHLKIGIEDVGAASLISSVFIKSGSLISNRQVYLDSVHYIAPLQTAVEGCAPVQIRVQLKPAQPQPYTVYLSYSGSAQNGTDYGAPDSILIAAGDTVGTFSILPSADGLVENSESAWVKLTTPCGVVYDSISFQISDALPFQLAVHDTLKCSHDTIRVLAQGALNYHWRPLDSLTVNTVDSSDVSLYSPADVTYLVTATVGSCSQTDTIRIRNGHFGLSVQPTDAACYGDSGSINVTALTTGAIWYWVGGDTNTSGLFRKKAGNYIIEAQTAQGCSGKDSVKLQEPPLLQLQVHSTSPPDCYGDSTGHIQLQAGGGNGGYHYEWPDGSANAFHDHLSGGIYIVKVTDVKGCQDSLSVMLTQPPQMQLLSKQIVPPLCHDSANGRILVQVSGGTGSYHYFWQPHLGDSSSVNVKHGIYYLEVKDSNQCAVYDTLVVGDAPSIYAIVLPKDTVIDRGVEVVLRVQTNISGGYNMNGSRMII
ncbi:MAG: choice-of-anchor L domain-containing protein [Chitinophagales bacterium]